MIEMYLWMAHQNEWNTGIDSVSGRRHCMAGVTVTYIYDA